MQNEKLDATAKVSVEQLENAKKTVEDISIKKQ
jgi:hypothetical protein